MGKKKIYKKLMLAIIFISLGGCINQAPKENFVLTNDIIGSIQKGPFISGSSINYFTLDSEFNQTGSAFNTQTINDIGTFEIKSGLSSETSNFLFVSQGFYFNEITGEISEVPLTLYLVSNILDRSSVKINLLTSLEKNRILYLIKNGSTYTEAVTKAHDDVLKVFYLSKSDIKEAQDLDITESGDDNAILLAISLILQGNSSTAELSDLVSDIALDIEKDGVLNNSNLGSQLKVNGLSLDFSEVKKNLDTFYNENGIQINVPDFSKYIKQFNTLNKYRYSTNLELPDESALPGDWTGPNCLSSGFTHIGPMRSEMGRELNCGFTAIVKNEKVRIVLTPLLDGIGVTLAAGNWELIWTDNYARVAIGNSMNSETRFDAQLQFNFYDITPSDNTSLVRIDIYENGSSSATLSKTIKYNSN